jgi:hypothetical protein
LGLPAPAPTPLLQATMSMMELSCHHHLVNVAVSGSYHEGEIVLLSGCVLAVHWLTELGEAAAAQAALRGGSRLASHTRYAMELYKMRHPQRQRPYTLRLREWNA